MRTVPPTEKGKYRAIASGAIANGKPVVVNTDGTVTGVGNIEGFSAGTAVNFEAAQVGQGGLPQGVKIAFDSSNNKVVIAYSDFGNSRYGTAIVGTVSGTAISFGTPVVFESAETNYPSIAFDSNANKMVIAFQDAGNSNYGKAIVGTVSGTGISFGSVATFNSGTSNYISISFDSNSNKVVIAYQDSGNSHYGTAIVGTVSSTSISFGSEAVFESATTSYIGTCFDSNSNKTVIAYRDGGNSNYGTAIVGTISSTSISFGSPTVFESASSTYQEATFDSSNNKAVIVYSSSSTAKAIVGTVSSTSISFGSATTFVSNAANMFGGTFDSVLNKILIAYRDANDSNHGYVILGTVSGTGISFGTPFEFENNVVSHVTAVFDSNVNNTVVAYQEDSTLGHGYAIVISSSSENLTTENYIGIANSCSFHGNTETITVTVAGGIFYLDGVANPVIQLLKGHTYIFDQADGTNSGHPLHFKDSGGSQYTTGVTVTGTAGTSGAKVTIVIASDATEPTRYYCTVHGNGMGNTINLSDSFVNVDVIGTVNDQQSSLTAGQQYFVQEDGTLGLTADSTSVFAGTAISATELVVKE